MSAAGKITAAAFRKCFAEVMRGVKGVELAKQYTSHPHRTRIMLNESGVLAETCKRLTMKSSSLEYKREVYTLDAVMMSGTDLIFPDSRPDSSGARLWYPSKLDVLIEHENGERLEEEMWKLLFWRADLKVLIGYDWCDDDKSLPIREQWRDKKLGWLRKMLRAVNADGSENSEYLVLIGNRKTYSSEDAVAWRWCLLNEPGTDFTSIGDHDG